ncbi:hypothetical protein DPM19_07565 [Actinomadura craniellae]|uniref:Uncharacterized protein n=1 Tax=Actinomadura craniellae TaxID=2231787 RepID=A0A365H929_9ACTN|nr:hypothetical protein [Actinomadura craniellae]RAY15640.1 hypothetical protein DPM19_07565 [Actinomadura craniellae]
MQFTFGRRHAAALVLLPALTLTACGGDDTSSAPPPSATGAPSAPAAGSAPAPGASGGTTGPRSVAPVPPQPTELRALTACMRKEGINIPEPPQTWSPPPGFDMRKGQIALQKCMKQLAPPSPR